MLAETKALASAAVRLAGDSGDGVQFAGMELTDASAVLPNDLSTLPEYPAEIRAPVGTVAGVSSFQINFGAHGVYTPGDRVDALIALNPAALKANLADVERGGIILCDSTEFTRANLRKAGYPDGTNPLEDETLSSAYKLLAVPIGRLTSESLADSGMSRKAVTRCRNMFALGVVFWLYDRPVDPTVRDIHRTFAEKKKQPEVADANIRAFKAGYHFGETAELFPVRYRVPEAAMPPGVYRRITGNEALATGLVAASKLANKQLVYCGYPITPASDLLHQLAGMRRFGVKTFQAEDEIAAAGAALGAAYAGHLGVAGTSGPGMNLKAETIGLATMAELPLVVLDVQRAGPSTGMPTKPEQADLLQALYGRNGESPVVVMAPRSPADGFAIAIEAVRTAIAVMAPVIVLSDGYLANSAEPWRVPAADSLGTIDVPHATDAQAFRPYERHEASSRPWAVPGTPGLQHRIGGLEKSAPAGHVSYSPDNHQRMTNDRQAKIDRLADRLPATEVDGDSEGELLVLGWGSTYGAITPRSSACEPPAIRSRPLTCGISTRCRRTSARCFTASAVCSSRR